MPGMSPAPMSDAVRSNPRRSDACWSQVVFEGSAATKIEWIVGGSVVKSATLSEKERGVPMKFVIKVSVPNPGGTSQVIQVTTEPRREALTFKAKEGVLQLLKAMGATAHSAVLRRMLAVSHRRQALWLALRSDKLPTESRQAALQVLAAALLEPKALEESELSACIEELLDFVIDLSPEGGSKLLGDDMLPCLDLRRGVVQVIGVHCSFPSCVATLYLSESSHFCHAVCLRRDFFGTRRFYDSCAKPRTRKRQCRKNFCSASATLPSQDARCRLCWLSAERWTSWCS